jgi:hypothetical protein
MAAPVLQMLTANRLKDGAVLYWKSGGWVEILAEGEVFSAQSQADAALQAAQEFVAKNDVVSPYLFDVHADGSPVKEREIIRAAGPSVRGDLGKQASSHPPLEGGPNFAQRNSRKGEALQHDPSPENPSDCSTLPQGEGGNTAGPFDVSL